MADGVLGERREEHVVVLTMNRLERHHALNRELAEALVDALARAEADDAVRAVVLTGAGEKSFCAGQDMLEASGMEPGAPGGGVSSAYLAIERYAASPLPLIAAVNGYCYGGGVALAIACDIRVAAERATFRFPGAEYGLVVGAASLPRLVGAARAKEIILTARKFGAADALSWGLVNQVVDNDAVLDAALALAHEISANSPIAVRESKRVIDLATLDDEAVATEDRINRELRGSDEQSERFRDATRKVTGR